MKNPPKNTLILILLFIVGASIISAAFICNKRNNKAEINGFNRMSFVFSSACSELKCKNDIVLANGVVTPNSYDHFVTFLRKNKDKIKKDSVICFNSPGGNNSAGFEIGREIARRGYSTCMADFYITRYGEKITNNICNSICPIIFAAGENRYSVGTRFSVGFHSSSETLKVCGWTICTFDMVGNDIYQSKFNKVLSQFQDLNKNRVNIKNQKIFVRKIFEIKNKSIAFLSLESAKKFNFYTQNL